jgi:hypothetical protein
MKLAQKLQNRERQRPDASAQHGQSVQFDLSTVELMTRSPPLPVLYQTKFSRLLGVLDRVGIKEIN